MPLLGKDRAIGKHRKNADKLVRALALEGMARLVRRTPVDTGRARNNWNLAHGHPNATNIREGEHPKDGGLAIAKAASQASGLKAGDVIYLTNALPYIPALEHGHSNQAPQGMIRLTAKELKPLANQIVRKVRGG